MFRFALAMSWAGIYSVDNLWSFCHMHTWVESFPMLKTTLTSGTGTVWCVQPHGEYSRSDRKGNAHKLNVFIYFFSIDSFRSTTHFEHSVCSERDFILSMPLDAISTHVATHFCLKVKWYFQPIHNSLLILDFSEYENEAQTNETKVK